jgi:hypothetical protein
MIEAQMPTVKPEQVRRYLLYRGWSHVQHPNLRIQMFRTSEDLTGDFASLVLPASADFSDAPAIIHEALRIVSSHEGAPIDRLVERLQHWDVDILRARLFLISGSEESLPFDVASETISGLREFMGYAAYTEFEPQPFFEKTGSVSAQFTKHCRFGHTFRGSFGVTVECPVTVAETPALPMDGNEPIIPFERKVIERVASGLLTLRGAINDETVEPMIAGYQKGFSANMCRALAEVYERADGRRIEIDISWSPELPSSSEKKWKPFVFEGRAYEFARVAAGELEKVEKFPDSVVEGRVVGLKSETPPGLDQQEEFDHVITMFWERERDQLIRIRVPLSPTQYMQACDAHKEGRSIRIYGVPQKQGKFWTLTKPHDFTVLAASSG